MISNRIKKNSGITLIALVITIIVMLILVAVTISMAINGGLFEYAGKAVGDTQNAIDKEQDLASGKITVDGKVYNSIDDYLAGNVAVLSYDQTTKDANGYLTANATYTSGDYTAIIPKGFKIIEGLDGTTTIADGLVIQDVDGNEFVWIPVTYTLANADEDNNGYDDGFDSVFYRSKWSNNARTTGLSTSYTEPYASGYTDGNGTEEIAEYNAMVKSVYDNEGFYIGRYEAGSTTARTNVANGTTEMIVKRDAYPYNYVGWGSTMSDYTSEITYSSKNQGLGALALSKGMYANKDVGVTSTLCYGIQWDAMLDFIKDDTHNVSNSTTWGNYKDNAWTITRTSAKYTTSPSSDTTWNLIDDEEADSKTKDSTTSILLTTGASDDFAAKNIFDVAGNVYERTNEAYSPSYRVFRGGSYNYHGSDYPASDRSSYVSPDYCNYGFLGFRAVLYIS